eukprot:TRINITY_DN10676_c0_g1_i1.p1 TRINITY_DN10676_c0_g1~~TRINITY_DN10676_c0_g1_i1.p1  ORF type:complete len:106 (+),score=7.88 TRINITY_DN10676_c0_g1_i1:28-345(+)
MLRLHEVAPQLDCEPIVKAFNNNHPSRGTHRFTHYFQAIQFICEYDPTVIPDVVSKVEVFKQMFYTSSRIEDVHKMEMNYTKLELLKLFLCLVEDAPETPLLKNK